MLGTAAKSIRLVGAATCADHIGNCACAGALATDVTKEVLTEKGTEAVESLTSHEPASQAGLARSTPGTGSWPTQTRPAPKAERVPRATIDIPPTPKGIPGYPRPDTTAPLAWEPSLWTWPVQNTGVAPTKVDQPGGIDNFGRGGAVSF
jgi:hypothetical protein